MKKRAGGVKHPKQNLPESLMAECCSKRQTRRELEVALDYSQHVINEQTQRLVSNAKQFDAEKKEWQARHASRRLEMQAKVVESAAHMIESLARMVGGDGF